MAVVAPSRGIVGWTPLSTDSCWFNGFCIGLAVVPLSNYFVTTAKTKVQLLAVRDDGKKTTIYAEQEVY